MKRLDFWLVLLLTVLLPVRGAVAATMAGDPAGPGSHHAVHMVQPAEPLRGHDGHGHAHAAHDHGDSHPDQHDKCSAACATPPLPSASTAVDAPRALSQAAFPALCAPAPNFVSEGPERPPRTL